MGLTGIAYPLGELDLRVNGIPQARVLFGQNEGTDFSLAPILPTGGAQVTVSEPAMIGGITGCENPIEGPLCNFSTYGIETPKLPSRSL